MAEYLIHAVHPVSTRLFILYRLDTDPEEILRGIDVDADDGTEHGLLGAVARVALIDALDAAHRASRPLSLNGSPLTCIPDGEGDARRCTVHRQWWPAGEIPFCPGAGRGA